MSISEKFETRTPKSAEVVEHQLRQASELIPLESQLPTDDPLQTALRTSGVEGYAVADINAGKQRFAIINVCKARNSYSSEWYEPFTDSQVVKPNTPHRFQLAEESPFLLVHFDKSGHIVGRALRPNEPVLVGREADEIDPKSARFGYKDDTHLSRKHFKITIDPNEGIKVIDNNSTNGTKVRYTGKGALKYETTPNYPAIEKPVEKEDRVLNAPLTSEVLLIPELFPKQEFKIGDRAFHMSDIIRGTRDRDYAVLYTTVDLNGQKLAVPRLLYKSNSDGGWRVAYGVESSGRLIKESHPHKFAHYTQETKLHSIILDKLEGADKVEDKSGVSTEKLLKAFSNISESRNEVNTAPEEISYYTGSEIDKLMMPIRKFSAGQFKEQDLHRIQKMGFSNFSEYIDYLDEVFESMPGFVPDFSGLPEKIVSREHTLLGEVTIEDYHAVFDNKPIIWSMARDKNGRVWVENVRFANAKVTSYGTFSPVLDAGIITNKPIEYTSGTSGLRADKEQKDFNGRYADITPLLSKLLPIKQYKKRFI